MPGLRSGLRSSCSQSKCSPLLSIFLARLALEGQPLRHECQNSNAAALLRSSPASFLFFLTADQDQCKQASPLVWSRSGLGEHFSERSLFRHLISKHKDLQGKGADYGNRYTLSRPQPPVRLLSKHSLPSDLCHAETGSKPCELVQSSPKAALKQTEDRLSLFPVSCEISVWINFQCVEQGRDSA